jgi:hypothetical protein
MPNIHLFHPEILQSCLTEPTKADSEIRGVETALMAEPDPEMSYIYGTVLAVCGKREMAAKLMKRAIENNYCSLSALRSDPLLADLRSSSAFNQLLAEAEQCQAKLLAGRNVRSM